MPSNACPCSRRGSEFTTQHLASDNSGASPDELIRCSLGDCLIERRARLPDRAGR